VPAPYCYAHPNTAFKLDGKQVTMGVYHDNRTYDKKPAVSVGKYNW